MSYLASHFRPTIPLALTAMVGLFLLVSPLKAENLLLVHGYVSGEEAWEKSRITEVLQSHGWSLGGLFMVPPDGVVQSHQKKTHGRGYFLADMPSEAPVSIQAEQLSILLQTMMKQDPEEKIFIAGHSTGGIVARLAMVRHPTLPVSGLITIASPNLGTDKAEWAGLLSSTPMAVMAPMVGVSTLNRSQSLYTELVREHPGTLLYWLNRQHHPQVHYLSIVRREGLPFLGDNIVPSQSQDLTHVQALGDKAQVVISGSGHALEMEDGVVIAETLENWIQAHGEP